MVDEPWTTTQEHHQQDHRQEKQQQQQQQARAWARMRSPWRVFAG